MAKYVERNSRDKFRVVMYIAINIEGFRVLSREQTAIIQHEKGLSKKKCDNDNRRQNNKKIR